MATMTAPAPQTSQTLSPPSASFGRTLVAMFCAGFSTFATLYCVQPVLPDIAAEFQVSAAQSSLALSLSTSFLALAIMASSVVSQALGRRGLMFASMLLASVLNTALALVTDWPLLLVIRALEGFVLGGVPAVAMAYLGEEIDPARLGKAMGVYVGGTALGAMIGRVGLAQLTMVMSWHQALGVIGVFCILSSLAFWVLLPPSRNFTPTRGAGLPVHLGLWAGRLKDPSLRGLYFLGFVLTSVFVSVFNYSTFRLSGAPFGLGPREIGLVFLAYIFGVFSSSLSGQVTARLGVTPTLLISFAMMGGGALLTLPESLPLTVTGIVLITAGFFIGHSVVSSCVGRCSPTHKGHAASLYLLFYYMGAGISGTGAGWLWQHGGWDAVALTTLLFSLAGAGVALWMRQRFS